MAGLRPHTKDYDAEARAWLGTAVIRARETLGLSRADLAQLVTGAGKTSIYKLESGRPVSASVYEAVARVLPGWTEDTPRHILDGGDAPEPETKTDRRRPDPPAPPPGVLTPIQQALLDEYAWWMRRLRDNPADFPRLIKLLDTYHQAQLEEESTHGGVNTAAQREG